MPKDLRLAELSDDYRALLTDRQYEIFDMYYNLDCSLAEIAETFGIARQRVLDCLVKVKESLERYEGALGIFAKRCRLRALCEEGRAQFDDPRVRELLERIKETVEG